jgi:menaquinone-9 beta-reductase
LADNLIKTDIAVIGAGPAGSTAAYFLASCGVKVTLLEQFAFPREKPCGDGVGSKGLDVMTRMGLSEWMQQFRAPQVLRMSAPDGEVIDMRPDISKGFCYGRTIPRQVLDARLADYAVMKGARLLEMSRVEGISRLDGHELLVQAGKFKVNTQLAILADGSQAAVTRRLGLLKDPPDLAAIRQYFYGDAHTERIEFHFQEWALPGYTWIFPLCDKWVNVGTGTFLQRIKQGKTGLQKIFERFISSSPCFLERVKNPTPNGDIRGHPLRTQFGKTRTHADRLLVAGDAAGLVNPLSGEGISAGMVSGEMVARFALKALEDGDFGAKNLSAYTRALETQFGDDWRAARMIRSVLNFPALLNRIFKNLKQNPDLAMLVGHVLVSHVPQRQILKPTNLLRLLF